MPFLSVHQTAEALHCSESHVYVLLSAQLLPAVRSNRRYYITSDAVEEFVRRHTHDGIVDSSLSYVRLLKDNPDIT